MPADSIDRRLFIGHNLAATQQLSASIGLPIHAPPTPPDRSGWDWPWRETLTTWGEELRSIPRPEAIVVCTWSSPTPAVALTDLDHRRWIDQVELPFATWFTAVTAAASLCADGGSVVVVAEEPAALDCSGRSDLTALAEGLAALTRSAALIHGPRRSRVNLVTTELFSSAGNASRHATGDALVPGHSGKRGSRRGRDAVVSSRWRHHGHGSQG